MKNESVKKQEIKGRNIFLSIHSGMTWTESTSRYDVWDLSGSTTTDKYIEIKSREVASTDYPTTFLEKKKYESLMALPSDKKMKAFYFVTFNDGVSYLFDLKSIKNIEDYSDRLYMKKTSLEGNTETTEKEIYNLPLSIAVKSYK